MTGDGALARSRAEGGGYREHRGDRGSVTGTGTTGVFVGQIAGDDLGYAGLSGAEARARHRGSSADDEVHPLDRARGDPPPRNQGAGPGHRVKVVHRVAAVAFAAAIATFGGLGLAGGLGFFSTRGMTIAGLSTNGALSVISIITAVALIAAAARGGRVASSTMIVIGVLFLVSAFANLAVLSTAFNLLAFRLPNVFFSLGAGLVLLVLGAYGRVSGHLPADNPYYREAHAGDPPEPPHTQPTPGTAEEAAADRAMAEAERAVTQGGGTDEQRRRLAAIHELRRHEDRRARWISVSDDPHARSWTGGSSRCAAPQQGQED